MVTPVAVRFGTNGGTMRPLLLPPIALFALPVAARSAHAQAVQGCPPGTSIATLAPALPRGLAAARPLAR
ncbi:MAG: hypothetical protein AcusKO_18290 [Acuticoccus sp.]